MNAKIHLSEIKSQLLIISVFLVLWFLNSYPLFATPNLSGYDSVIRLFQIDQLFVGIAGNIWLPAFQFFLRSINLITNDLFIFKLFNYSIATFAILIFYYVSHLYFGRYAAVAVLGYFLMHVQWLSAATSLYLEPLFLLTISLAILFYYYKKYLLFGLFFILATFTRPELLIAAPILLTATIYYTKNIRRTFFLAILYLPIICFYWWMKINFSEFQHPRSFNFQLTKDLIISLLDVYFTSRIFLLEGLLALAGVGVLIFKKVQVSRKLLLVIFIGLGCYLVLYALFVPYFHGFSQGGGGTRKSMYLVIPSFWYVGIFCQYLSQRRPQWGICLASILIVLSATHGYYNRGHILFWPYQAAMEINQNLSKIYSKQKIHYLCDLTGHHDNYEKFSSIVIDQVHLYLRLAGWRLEVIPCNQKTSALWQKLIKSKRRFVLRIYDFFKLDPVFQRSSLIECEKPGYIKDRGQVRGRYCF